MKPLARFLAPIVALLVLATPFEAYGHVYRWPLWHPQILVPSCHATPSTQIIIATTTAVGTGGGATTITADTGGLFPTSPTVEICLNVSGGGCGSNRYYALNVLSATTTQISASVPSGLTAGSYDVRITSRSCGGGSVRGALQIVAVRDFATVCGSNLDVWYSTDVPPTCGGGSCANSGLVDSWADKSGNGRTLTASGSARPTFHTNATFAPAGLTYSSVTFDGVNNILKNTAVTLANATDIATWLVLKQTTAGTSQRWACVTDPAAHAFCQGTNSTNSTQPVFIFGGTSANAGNSITSTGSQTFGSIHQTGSPSILFSVSERNQPAGTTTLGGGSWSSGAGGAVSIGGTTSTASAPIEVVEFASCHYQPSSTDLSDIANYLNSKYFLYTPGYTAATDTCNVSNGFRILGPGGTGSFLTGMTVSFGGALSGVIATQTATVRSASVADIPMPGTTTATGKNDYPITLKNPDGGEITAPTGLTTYSDLTTSPTVSVCDNSTLGWYSLEGTQGAAATFGFNYTTSAGTVTDMFDQALNGNNIHEGTNPPTFTSSDSNYPKSGGGNANSMSFNATNQKIGMASFNMGANASPALDAVTTARFATGSVQQYVWDFNNSGTVSFFDNLAHAATQIGGVGAQSTGTFGATTQSTWNDRPSGVNPLLAVSVNNGTAVTQTTSTSALTNAAVAFDFGTKTSGSNWYGGSVTCAAFFNRSLTSTERGNLRTWMQAHCGAP